MYAYAEPDADDRTHERRYEHGSDNDGGRVGVEPERGYEDGEDKNEYICAVKRHIVAD